MDELSIHECTVQDSENIYSARVIEIYRPGVQYSQPIAEKRNVPALSKVVKASRLNNSEVGNLLNWLLWRIFSSFIMKDLQHGSPTKRHKEWRSAHSSRHTLINIVECYQNQIVIHIYSCCLHWNSLKGGKRAHAAELQSLKDKQSQRESCKPERSLQCQEITRDFTALENDASAHCSKLPFTLSLPWPFSWSTFSWLLFWHFQSVPFCGEKHEKKLGCQEVLLPPQLSHLYIADHMERNAY